jgi:hypothetical protein
MTVTQQDPPAVIPGTWSERLAAPFPPEVISYRPQPWCKPCNDAPGKVCGKHAEEKCKTCGNTLTNAHFDAEYVGHADTTTRLNEVDPAWSWEPAYRDVDREVLMAAIASGNPEIVKLVIENSPPKYDQFRGMWMKLVVHDDQGDAHERLCYGDAGTKSGPNAVKELIGDGIRNGAMRFGVATGLWSKSERAAAREGTANANGSRQIKPAAQEGRVEPGGTTAEPDTPAGTAVATALAKLARTIALKPDSTVDELQAQVHAQAQRRKQLTTVVPDPFNEGQTAALRDIILHAKSVIERRPEARQPVESA